MDQFSDEQILSGLTSEDKNRRNQMLKVLYTQHFSFIANFISKNNGTSADAADIFQDALIVFYEKAKTGNFTLNCTIRTFIYSICKNLWLNRLRNHKKQTTINDEISTIAIEPESLDVINTKERQKVIMQLIEKLGSDCQKVLTLYYFDRLRMKEIAEQMNFASEQVAKNKKAKCMQKLRAMILDSPRLKDILK